jgi:hypothetical protein
MVFEVGSTSRMRSLRYDLRPGLVREFQDRRDFGDRPRPQHHGRMAAEQIAHLDEIRRLRLRIGNGEFIADDCRETGEQIGADGFFWLVVRLIEHWALPLRC